MTTSTSPLQRRLLRFNSIDDISAEMDRIVAADRAGRLRRAGNWTAGQVFGHLSAWIDYGYEGYPMQTPWLVKVIAKVLKNQILYKPMRPGMRVGRVVGGTYGTEMMSTDDGARRYRASLERLKRGEVLKFPSPAFGPLTNDEVVALNLRHAELHIGFLLPE